MSFISHLLFLFKSYMQYKTCHMCLLQCHANHILDLKNLLIGENLKSQPASSICMYTIIYFMF